MPPRPVVPSNRPSIPGPVAERGWACDECGAAAAAAAAGRGSLVRASAVRSVGASRLAAAGRSLVRGASSSPPPPSDRDGQEGSEGRREGGAERTSASGRTISIKGVTAWSWSRRCVNLASLPDSERAARETASARYSVYSLKPGIINTPGDDFIHGDGVSWGGRSENK